MHKIIYYVATSLDGFIAGPNEDISAFMAQGEGVQQYLNDLQEFQTVIMGRKTYEFGYRFGLKPGEAPYPHMQHYIFSNSLELENSAENVQIVKRDAQQILDIKKDATSNIYLCGGGAFAGWLLELGLIDQLKIKLNPIVLGDGIQLFGTSKQAANWQLTQQQVFKDGLLILTYDYQKN